MRRAREAEAADTAEAAGPPAPEQEQPEQEPQEPGGEPGGEPAPQGPDPQGPSEAEMLELLSRLSAEEPDARAPVTQVTIGASIVLIPLGAVVLLWGVVAFFRVASGVPGAAMARTGAATMIVFGMGFVAAGFWLIYRLMKQRGVV